jgi:hypothetical protein
VGGPRNIGTPLKSMPDGNSGSMALRDHGNIHRAETPQSGAVERPHQYTSAPQKRGTSPCSKTALELRNSFRALLLNLPQCVRHPGEVRSRS